MLYHFGTSERHFSALARFGARQAGLKGRWPPYDLYIYIASDRSEIRHITVGLAGARPNYVNKSNRWKKTSLFVKNLNMEFDSSWEQKPMN